MPKLPAVSARQRPPLASTRLPQVDTGEWLDQGLGSPADVAANLAEMGRINAWLGGTHALTRHLYPRLPLAPKHVTLLDLGTGGAGLPLAIARWARAHGRAVSVTAVDWAARSLAVARSRTAAEAVIQLLQADAARLPLAAGSVDFVISSLFLHHFPPPQAVELLRAGFALARRGLLMSDLVRGWLPLAAFRLVQPVFARHPFTRHDGALSIRRAYTPSELRALAATAGLPGARVYAHWPWRMTLVVDRAGGG